MTYYLVKEAANDWRVYDEAGNQIDSYSSEPTAADVYADAAEDLGLSTTTATAVGELLANGFRTRDLTLANETVPW